VSADALGYQHGPVIRKRDETLIEEGINVRGLSPMSQAAQPTMGFLIFEVPPRRQAASHRKHRNRPNRLRTGSGS
jgi:hypothetical protein